jgi:hypothetical protein
MLLQKHTLFCALLLWAACKNEPKNNAGTSPGTASNPNTEAPSATSKPEMILYALTVDALQLRDQPTTKGSKVVAKFKEDDFVTGTGEKSSNMEEITLRGIPYKDAFYKVTSTTPEEHTGWAFGGALLPVYAGSRANSPDLGKLVQFKTFLNGLNKKDLNSGKKAWDYVLANFADASGPLADAAYILTDAFFSRMEVEGEFYVITEKIKWTPEDYDAVYKGKFDMNKYPMAKSLSANGFRLETAEGMVFPVGDYEKFYQFFASKASPSMNKYLTQNLAEQREPESEDAGLALPLGQVAERAAFWEKFNKENPYFLLSERTRINEAWLLGLVLCGNDNAPIFDFESKKLSPEFQKTWQEVQQKYPGTQLAAKTKEISDLFATTNGLFTETIEAWMNKFQEQKYQ